MTTSSVTSAGTTSAAPTTTSNKALISSDFDTFLKMLTAQMQNQDPLNPMDSTDYATQLATFSGVEQQARTNELLTNLGSQMAVLGMSQLAGWVGQEARAEAPVWMDGDPVTMQLTPATGAGDPLPMGAYTLTLESYSGDTLLGETPVESYARIIEARNGASGAMLVLEGGIEVLSSKITALRVPEATGS